jgi:ATP-dependent protease ClpP protease subunit
MPKAARPQNRKPTPPTAAPASRWFEIQNLAEPGFAEIRLRGIIGEPRNSRDWWTGEMVENTDAAGTLAEFEQSLEALGDVENLQISIFSQGGDWATGVAIHNLLIRHPANKVCIIDGLCASAATYPAMACQEIRSPSNASLLIHEASNMAYGTAADLRAAAQNLDNISQSIAELYAARTGKPVDEIRSLMQEDRYLSAQEALDLGLIDTLIEPLANLASRNGSLQPTNCGSLQNAPAEILALFDMRSLATATRNTSPMKIRTPLMNAAADPAAPAGVTPGAAPTPSAPVAPVAPVAAPVNVAPPAPAALVVTTEIQNAITTAVNAAVAPLQAEVTRLTGLGTAGITVGNLAGAPPVAGVTSTPAPKIINRADFAQLGARARSEFLNSGGKITD